MARLKNPCLRGRDFCFFEVIYQLHDKKGVLHDIFLLFEFVDDMIMLVKKG